MTHLQCFERNRRHSLQISCIALVLQDRLLPQLDPVLLLQLLDHGLEEIDLCLPLLRLRGDFNDDLLFHPLLVQPVSGHLSIELEALHASHHKAPSKE